MKNLVALLVCVTLMFCDVSVLYAGNASAAATASGAVIQKDNVLKYEGEPLVFRITSGLEKREEYTFDDKRTISGVAENNTKISFYFYRKNAKNEFELTNQAIETITVNKSGIFNKEIAFELGETKLIILAENGKRKTKVEVILNRLDSDIKKELQNYLLPEQKIRSNNLIY